MEAGDGPPVILLHGFPETSYAWRKQIPVLAVHYRVVAPDLRGYGETEKPASGYDKRTMAADIRALMAELWNCSGTDHRPRPWRPRRHSFRERPSRRYRTSRGARQRSHPGDL